MLEKGKVKRPRRAGGPGVLEGVRAEIPAALQKRAVAIASREKTFEPHIEVVPLNGFGELPQPRRHHAQRVLPLEGKPLHLGLYKNGAKKDFTFATPGLVRIYCNIHPQMSAFLQVMENPYFAWTNPDGGFLIDDVPPGNYRLKAWHEEGETTQPLSVTESGATGLVVQIDVSGFAKRPHLNKFGKPYKREKY